VRREKGKEEWKSASGKETVRDEWETTLLLALQYSTIGNTE